MNRGFLLGSPSAPTDLQWNTVPGWDDTTVKVNWKAPAVLNGNNPDKIEYEFTYCVRGARDDDATITGQNCSTLRQVGNTEIMLTMLLPGRMYHFSVRADSENNEIGGNLGPIEAETKLQRKNYLLIIFILLSMKPLNRK